MKLKSVSVTSHLVFILLLSLCGVGVCGSDTNAKANLILCENGKAKAIIVIPAFKNPKEPLCIYTMQAAEWLKKYLKESTGADIPIVKEGTPSEGIIISVGPTTLASSKGLNFGKEKWNTCTATVRDGAIFILGHDSFGPVNDGGHDCSHLGSKGTSKAVAMFLEKCLGVRWYMPGPLGTKVPKFSTLEIPADLSLNYKPVFAYLNGRELYAGIAAHANNNVTSVIVKTYGGHSWPVWIPKEKYFAEHPEYFRMDDAGKRVADYFGNICTSNSEVKKIMLHEMRRLFDLGYEWVQLGQSDGYQPCRCKECESLDNYLTEKECGSKGWNYFKAVRSRPAERINLLHKYLIDECAKSHPDRKVHFLVYRPTQWPSKKFEQYGKNVIAEVCKYPKEALPVWSEKCDGLTVYVYWLGAYNGPGIAPTISLERIADNFRLYRKNNVVGIYLCGALNKFGLMGPQLYAMGKLTENPEADPWPYAEEFCNFIYGPSAQTMLEFHRKLDERAGYYYDRLHRKGGESAAKVFPLMFPEKVITELDSLLTKAEASATGRREKGYIRAVRESFDYAKCTAAMFTVYRQLGNPSYRNRVKLSDLHNSVETWKQYCSHLVQLEEKDPEFLADFYGPRAYEYLVRYLGYGKTNRGRVGSLRSTITVPANWPLELMTSTKESMSEADDVAKLVLQEDFDKGSFWSSSGLQSKISKGGKDGNCLRVRGTAKKKSSISLNSIKTLKDGGLYRITSWLNMKEESHENGGRIAPLTFTVIATTKSGEKISATSTPYFPALSGWQELVVDGMDLPANLASLSVSLPTAPAPGKTSAKVDFLVDSLRIVMLKRTAKKSATKTVPVPDF